MQDKERATDREKDGARGRAMTPREKDGPGEGETDIKTNRERVKHRDEFYIVSGTVQVLCKYVFV